MLWTGLYQKISCYIVPTINYKDKYKLKIRGLTIFFEIKERYLHHPHPAFLSIYIRKPKILSNVSGLWNKYKLFENKTHLAFVSFMNLKYLSQGPRSHLF